jgi:prevent-host-death family protein
MKTVSFTEFRKQASNLLTDVEHGEILVIIRHGKPIAEIVPVSEDLKSPSWKKPGLRLAVKDAKLSSAILEDRERENIL